MEVCKIHDLLSDLCLREVKEKWFLHKAFLGRLWCRGIFAPPPTPSVVIICRNQAFLIRKDYDQAHLHSQLVIEFETAHDI